MKINSLVINNFRHIEDTTIEFGDKLTIITGQNGTGKSSILGWVAQLVDFKEKNKRLNDKYFKEDYKNVFRFCPENDYSKNYSVTFNYKSKDELLDSTKNITTRLVEKTEKSPQRYRTDIDGRGKTIDFPLIYLGLKRLIPLATEKSVKLKTDTVDNKYHNTFSKLSKEILILVDDKIKPESIKSSNKDILAMKTNEYSHLGNSAGQDNIGQIISSLLSFQKLKDEQKENYKGGIILIDELDASLYAGSQIKLIDKLYRFATNLNLQIIFTTHSLEIIEHLNEKLGNDTKINHLVIRDSKVHNVLNPSFDYISNKIKNQVKLIDKIKLKNIICEDKVAEMWSNNLLNGTDLKKLVKIEKGPFSFGTLEKMAVSKHSLFDNVSFILDGDVKEKYQNKKKPNKTAFLPKTARPETVLYEFVKNLSDTDEIWNDEANFTKQTCFANYMDSNKGTHKRWFEDDINSKFFGRGYSKLFNRWKKDNKTEVDEFIKDIEKII